MTRRSRALLSLAMVLVAAVILPSCGRKESLTPPPGADYPRQYPRE